MSNIITFPGKQADPSGDAKEPSSPAEQLEEARTNIAAVMDQLVAMFAKLTRLANAARTESDTAPASAKESQCTNQQGEVLDGHQTKPLIVT
ncbi:hypothetical protein ATY78_06890 [Rhizobium sp. R635]|uniref:hypothetical protein n=1 Tax=Rhizobium sp. R635 TaxID=1764275 RepID=UPI000B7463FB|nr:hypothetical protein [Rhizobium sp. R635]OWV80411.1 hypothetical protein ATY78_06890 [Rhizobium sp. R635]